MDVKRVCTKCNQEKTIELFPEYKKRNGLYSYRNECKDCMNQRNRESRAKKKGIEYKSEKITPKEINYNMFTESEIEILKNIASKNNELMTILNNRIDFEKIEDLKIKKSITISKLNHKKILELSKNKNINYSQIVDSLLQKGLESI